MNNHPQKVKVLAAVVCLFGAFHFMAGCKSDDGPNPEQVRLQELSQTWVLGTVTNDGNDVTSQFTGFSLTVDQFSFTTQNGGNAWPGSGTYSFVENDLDRILRSDGVEMSVTGISSDDLTLSFQISTVSGGRISGVNGSFVFSLKRQ